MRDPAFQIIDPGLFTTVQDLGRHTYQRYGVPVSGAMDAFALQAANLLVGNESAEACLEITVQGPTIHFLTDMVIAITGSDMSPQLDGEDIPRWEPLDVKQGTLLTFGQLRDGMRAYVAFKGGIDVPTVLDSRSTYTHGGFGGYRGRTLKSDDVLPVSSDSASVSRRKLPSGYTLPVYGNHHEIRVVLGPQDDLFTEDTVATFLTARFKISTESDRMGYKLVGPTIESSNSANIISDGNALGVIQIPGVGSPRILLSDRGTTGGYPKIATVITADIGKLAQALPDHTLRFNRVSIEEAHDALEHQNSVLRALSRQGKPLSMTVSIGDTAYQVETPDGLPVTKTSLHSASISETTRRLSAVIDGKTFDFKVDVTQEA